VNVFELPKDEKKKEEEKIDLPKDEKEKEEGEKENDLQRFFSFLDFFLLLPILQIPPLLSLLLLTLLLQALMAVFVEVSAKKI
jgi:hypothetical protein